MERELKVKGTGSWFMHEENVKDITIQGFILTAITTTVKCTLVLDLKKILTKSLEHEM